jgi:hypothetical protein
MANCAAHFSRRCGGGGGGDESTRQQGGPLPARAAGPQVGLTGPDQEAVSLARAAIADGARSSASPAATARFPRWPR